MKFVKCSNYKREEDEDGPGLREKAWWRSQKQDNKKILKSVILDHRDQGVEKMTNDRGTQWKEYSERTQLGTVFIWI